jgi:hypothetical protein
MVGVGLGVWLTVGDGVKVCVGVDVEVSIAVGEHAENKKTKSNRNFECFMFFPFLMNVQASIFPHLPAWILPKQSPHGN